MVTISKFQAQIGFNFTLLDIGGGFPGAPDAAITFEEVSYEVIYQTRETVFEKTMNSGVFLTKGVWIADETLS